MQVPSLKPQRIIDDVPRTVDLELLQPLAKSIGVALLGALNMSGEDGKERCQGYLEEAPDVAELRRELEVREKRLQQARKTIKDFQLR